MEGFKNILGRMAIIGAATLSGVDCSHAATEIREVEVVKRRAPRRGMEMPPKVEPVVLEIKAETVQQAKQIQAMLDKRGGEFVVEEGNRFFWIERLMKNVNEAVLAGLRISEYAKCSDTMPCGEIALRKIERFGKGQKDYGRELFRFTDFDELSANQADSGGVGANGQVDRVGDFTKMNTYSSSSWNAHCSPAPSDNRNGYIDKNWHAAFDNGNEVPSRVFMCVQGENPNPQHYQDAYAQAVANVTAGIKAGRVSTMGPRQWGFGGNFPSIGVIDTGGGTGKVAIPGVCGTTGENKCPKMNGVKLKNPR